MMVAHAWTGHKKGWPDRCMLMVWCFSLFFWEMNVIDTMSAEERSGLLCDMRDCCLKNRMLPMVRTRVVRDSDGDVVLLYSQDRIAKKKAPMMSWVQARARGSLESLYSLCTFLMTDTGSAFWRCSLASESLKLAKRRLRLRAVFPFISSRGSGTLFSRKVCASTLREFRIDPSAIGILPRVDPFVEERKDWAKRPMISER
jgi:hypothetical protein